MAMTSHDYNKIANAIYHEALQINENFEEEQEKQLEVLRSVSSKIATALEGNDNFNRVKFLQKAGLK